MRVMMEHESFNDQLINKSNKLDGCHESVTSQEQAIVIQRAWRKYRNEFLINNNNLIIETTKSETSPLETTILPDETIENSIKQDTLSVNCLDMSLSSYSNTDESFQSNLDSAAEDLHSDYDSSSCGREYILNADDDRNNNYFPNLDQNEKQSDSANSSYYGSVEDALDEIATGNPDNRVKSSGGSFISPEGNESLSESCVNNDVDRKKIDEDKTSAILNYIEDQKQQTYDEIKDGVQNFNNDSKILNVTDEVAGSDENVFTRKNYWDFCNQQKFDNQKLVKDNDKQFQSFPRENPFGSDFSKWDLNGEEFAKIRDNPSADDLITWDSVHKSRDEAKDETADGDVSIDLITGDISDEIQTVGLNRCNSDDAVSVECNTLEQRVTDEPSRTKKRDRSYPANFPDVIGPRQPANMKKECAAMLQNKLANEAEMAAMFRPRSKSTLGQQNPIKANTRHSPANYDRMKRSFSMQNGRRNKKTSPEMKGDFDVYNIETAMPTIDWAVMERHLVKSAKEQELYHKRRNDREEIRRKLAMGTESDDYYGGEKMTKKPSLTTRLQSGMNLQICFMNETASDQDSQGSDHDVDGGSLHIYDNKLSSRFSRTLASKEKLSNNRTKTKNISMRPRPSFFKESLNSVFHATDNLKSQSKLIKDCDDVDFLTKQARLQAEARMALAQAKEMAHMQMEIEKQQKKKSPIAEMVGIAMPDCHRRLSRQVLTGMNVAQLQVIVNDLHTQIETLNEDLVKFLLERDDLHMEQDSMLVDIEDLTRYLGDKEETKKQQRSLSKKYKKGKK